jgi:hypothetical protein
MRVTKVPQVVSFCPVFVRVREYPGVIPDISALRKYARDHTHVTPRAPVAEQEMLSPEGSLTGDPQIW